ncbi:DM13 domain-containing protein [Arthrobacter sp. NPDC090010]|uniref:DM13 domain-containing protein n=1 Tax=Arthrobacter sp. NPDC090010 TaxID=3363942 RepID=UPI00381E3379
MRKLVLGSILLATAGLGLAACGSPSSTSSAPSESGMSSMSPSMSASPSMGMMHDSSAASRSGMFAGLNGKKVSGSATLSGGELMLSGFSSDQGPDLHVYLTHGTDESAVTAGKELAPVKFDAASQTFSLNGIDASGYTDVVIHCDKAKAVFGAAKLT